MAENKALVIDVQKKSVPQGAPKQWENLSNIHIFTRDIVTPDIQNDADVSALVSGIPTVFARANLFASALAYNGSIKDSTSALNQYYQGLVDEWRGLIACLALDANAIDVKQISLGYSDGKGIKDTANVYEPTGAFGNMLFNSSPKWCLQRTNENENVYPFVNVIKFDGQVVAGTSPDTLLFTSANYKLSQDKPYVNVKTGKFTDPQKSNLSSDEWLALYAYVENISKQLPILGQYYTPEGKKSLVDYGNIGQELKTWLGEIKANILKKGYDLEKATPLPVDSFKIPYSLVFNFSDELYGLNGKITQTDSTGKAIKFNPEKLLLEKNAEIARIPLGSEFSRNPNKLSELSIYVLKANKVGQDGFAFFALPLSEEGVRVFGENIGVLLGQDETGTSIKSQLIASYDEQLNKLDVKLLLITDEDKTKAINVTYKVRPEMISKKDLLLWPNFISKQWKRYFLYSELPHNDNPDNCPFRAVPFVGDENDTSFSTICDNDGNIIYLANDGRANGDENVKAKLHIVADRISHSKYQYEIYESEHPFKGVKLLTTGTRMSGFILIRYARENGKRMPWNRLGEQMDLRDAHLGMDFGSTNTSIAYFDTVKADDPKGIVFKDMRVSLLCDIHGIPNTPTIENSLFFFQGQELQSNSVKSILTVQDFKRMPQNESVDALCKKEVSGGFPCFCKNLPVTSISNDKINVSFFNGTGISATLIQNMKWSDQDIDRAHKSAFLKSLLLQVYAQLFVSDVVPVKLKWSYPSAMPDSLVRDYDSIWNDLKYITPVIDRDGNVKRLDVTEWQASKVEVGENIWGTEDSFSINDTWGASSPSNDNWGGSTSGDAWGTDNSSGGWGDDNTSSSAGWGSYETQDGWGNSQSSNLVVDLKPDDGPIKFNFVDVNQETCLTEACAVANYLHKSVDARNLTLCFDVGGSTTDISALCKMRDKNGQLRTAMIKQNSIHFAAQRVSLATKNIPSFKKVLDAICQKYNIRILGLNMGQNTFSQETAPYFYEQIVDNLNSDQLVDFYKCISAISPDLFSVNLYVTGLIMYYAGQIANKLIQEVRRAEDGLGPEWRPLVQIVFAGKGSRIFEWFSCTNYERANKYCLDMFIHGFGGMDQAKNLLYGPPSIGLASKSTPDNKYEVSKGLAMASHQSREGGLIVPDSDRAIEILGEDGFSLITKDGSKVDLKYDNGITTEYMEHIGNYFLGPIDGAGEMTCKRFMDFSSIYYQYAKNLYKLDAKLSQSDFVNGFKNMNINTYIKSLPEFRKAIQNKGSDGSGKFDFVAPIIILEGMKFFDEVLLPKLKQ